MTTNFLQTTIIIVIALAASFIAIAFIGIPEKNTDTPKDSPKNEQLVFDGGFDSGDEHQWGELHYNNKAKKENQFSIVSSPVREGKYAAKLTVGSKDKFKQTSGERCDLERPKIYDEKEGDEFWYAWSTLFPQDWQTPKGWFIIADWHSSYEEVCQLLQVEVTTENALIAKVLTGDVTGYDCFDGSGTAFTTEKTITSQIQTGTWNDFIIHVKWTAQPTGLIEIYHKTEKQQDFNKVVSLSNIPTLQYQDDINRPKPPYFKLAHYRSELNTHTSTLYHDGFRQGKTQQSIARGNLYRLGK